MIAFLLPLLLAQQVKMPPAAEIRPLITNEPDREHLTLQAVLDSVEKHYPPLRVALLEQPIAEADYLAAQGRFDLVLRSFFDTNNLGFYDSRRFDVSVEQPTTLWGTSFFSGYQVSGGSFPSYDGKFQTNGLGEYRAGMRMPLFRDRAVDGRRADLRKADLNRRLADLTVQQQRLVILQAATARYWNWVAAGRRFAVAQAILDIAVQREKILETAVELGQLPRFEVLDNKRIIEQRRSQFVAARRGVEQTAFDLSLFYRDAQGQPRVALVDQLPPAFPRPSNIDEQQLERDIAQALDRRPELARLSTQQDQVRVDQRLAENRRLPGLDFILSYDRELGARRVPRGPNELRAGVVFELPVQRRTATGQAVAARTRINQIDQRLQFQREQVAVEVRDAVSAVRAAYEGTNVLEAEVRATREVEDAERTRYDLGESTLFVLNQRELQTADAQVREVSALADYYRALALYELAVAQALRPRP
ncbi:MAG: TolC family protein [Bryobacteraceae bacterium]|nr:TolC family protein [Bryobacteraceae bacterium]